MYFKVFCVCVHEGYWAIVLFSLIGFSGFITMVFFLHQMSLEVFFLAKNVGKIFCRVGSNSLLSD